MRKHFIRMALAAGGLLVACGGGDDTNDPCGPGAELCGDDCTVLAIDPENCGECGNVCGADEVCSDASCIFECVGGTTDCGGSCVNTDLDPDHCGGCDSPCAGDEVCSGGSCDTQCVGGTTLCDGACVNTDNDPLHCGACNDPCPVEELCSVGQCWFQCVGGTTDCTGICVDTDVDPANCGVCGYVCGSDELCDGGNCASVCGTGLTMCGNNCVDLATDPLHCGACNDPCSPGEECINTVCTACDTATTDCDGDGWMEADGDCCDLPGACGSEPELVNPGAIEVIGNGLDDNCNGLTDLFDTEDAVACDSGLASNSMDPTDYARAMGICRMTTENPPLAQKTWGLIDAQLLQANGTALPNHETHSIRATFGSVSPATLEGQRVVVLSSGIASDGVQTNPGPNGGVPNGGNVSSSMGGTADISNCSSPLCIDDWYAIPNPPLKNANELPSTPNCTNGLNEPIANDSVMLYLRLRAPTNARAFSFNTYFFSAEFPEYVCTTYNDQLIALIDTPNGTPQPIPNPVDKNLMTYSDGVGSWPVGINIASGTSLFAICDSQATNPGCWDTDVDPASCSLGAAQLSGTGYEAGGSCTIGGATYWLTTSGNVIPGDLVELRIVIWDVGDSAFDSLVLIDGFRWLSTATMPGTG